MPDGRMLPSVDPSQKPMDHGPRLPPEPREKPYAGLLVIVVAVIVVVAFLVAFFPANPTPTYVTSVNITSQDRVCGLGGNILGGFDAGLGATVNEGVGVYNRSSCTIQSVSITTAGFELSGANTPLAVPAYTQGYLLFNITVPSTAYTGAITINVE
jgi:hypothetical protein